MTWLAFASCLLAVLPALLFLRNLSLYRLLPAPGAAPASCSVLIPARDEAAHIAAAVDSVLNSTGVELEVIVLDDGSTDATAEIVRSLARRDPRVRLVASAPLPPGWCGKNFACAQLAQHARHSLLVFMDADVRVARADSVARLLRFLVENDAVLVSGVPRQETHRFLEILIIPLIHFVLLAYLPLHRMRAGCDPRFAAACGQILAIRRDVYLETGGHGAVRTRLHEAVALTRLFLPHVFERRRCLARLQ